MTCESQNSVAGAFLYARVQNSTCSPSYLSFPPVLVVPFLNLTGIAMLHLEKPDNELELLRRALSLDHTLFTVQRHTSRPKGHIRVDCYASMAAGGPGLTRITRLVAGVLKYRRNCCGLIVNNREDVDYNLLVALSNKLKLDLKHERLNSHSHCCPILFF